MKRFLFSFILSLSALHAFAQGPDLIIPSPAEVTIDEGTYSFRKKPKITFINLQQGEMPSESYRILIDKKNGVTISYADDAGLLYAMNSLAQMTAKWASSNIM